MDEFKSWVQVANLNPPWKFSKYLKKL